MHPTDQIAAFVHDALRAGRAPQEIDTALAEAGWSQSERAEALRSWAQAPGMPPIPRPRPYVSAREALLYGLLFVSLVMVAWHTCQLGFSLIDSAIPDVESFNNRSSSDMRWNIAALIGFTPVFVLLNRHVLRAGANDEACRRSLVRKWFASVTLLVAAIVLLGDVVTLIYSFLNGDLTMRILARVGLVAAVAGLVFSYYKDELDG